MYNSLSPRRLVLSLLAGCAACLLGASREAVLGQETLLISTGDSWKFLKGTAPPPEEWREVDFDDSDWFDGPTGIGYGDADDATLLDDMVNGYLTIFTRRTFNVPNPAALRKLALRVTYDDGIVAYINGTEIGRANMPDGEVTESSPALAAIEPGAPVIFEFPGSLLETGLNVVAVSVHNAALSSSDLSFIPELVTNVDVCPKTITCSFDLTTGVTLSWANLKTYESIDIRRNGEEIETGLDGSLQTFVDPAPPTGEVTYAVVVHEDGAACPGIECTLRVTSPEDVLIAPGDTWKFLRGTAPVAAGWFEANFDDGEWEEGPTGIGYGDGDDATVLDDMLQRADDPLTPDDESLPGYLSVFARKEFTLSSLDGLEGLLLSIVYDDGFVVFLNGEEVARNNVPDGEPTDLTAAVVAGEPGPALQIEIPLGAARVGRNVLAVSVHNAAVTSSDLSFIPLLAREGGGGPASPAFRRGDADDSGVVNLTDAVSILRALFQGGNAPACADAADVDDSGLVNLTDAVFLLRFLFQGGGTPPLPGVTSCGPDATADDALAPCSAASCTG